MAFQNVNELKPMATLGRARKSSSKNKIALSSAERDTSNSSRLTMRVSSGSQSAHVISASSVTKNKTFLRPTLCAIALTKLQAHRTAPPRVRELETTICEIGSFVAARNLAKADWKETPPTERAPSAILPDSVLPALSSVCPTVK